MRRHAFAILFGATMALGAAPATAADPPMFLDLGWSKETRDLLYYTLQDSYLHNGSVPTVYELLSPVAERRAVFWTGGRELDRERLGFVSDDPTGRFRFDTSLAGNHNTGHLYAPQGLSRAERLAIIEYLKTQ